MRLLSKLLKRSLSKDKFARMIMKRIRAGGETADLVYDKDNFAITVPDRNVFNLSNAYAAYQKLEDDESREDLIRLFLTTWFTSQKEMPEEFEDVKADLLPSLRARSYFETDIRLSTGDNKEFNVAYEIVGDALGAAIAYDMPTSMSLISQDVLDDWGVTFYEAMEVAKANLLERTEQYAQVGSVYTVAIGDAYDASRILLTELLCRLEVQGEMIAMIPNRECLFVTGSDDDSGLETMLTLVEEQIEHERYLTGLAFKYNDGWQSWMPNQSHPLYKRFRSLQVQTIGSEYDNQQKMLDREGDDIFVATFSALEEKTTGEVRSYCAWTKGADSLLPKTDHVVLMDVDKQEAVASGDWKTVASHAGDLMEPQDIYPERWRVKEFPSEEVLKRIGKAEIFS